MKASLTLLTFLITMLISPSHYSEPGFNGTAAGCGASGCHTSQPGIIPALFRVIFKFKLHFRSTSSVAGGLVDGRMEIYLA